VTWRYAALAVRLLAVASAAIGLIRLTGLFGGGEVSAAFTFYTTQSNILCLLWMALLAVVTVKDIVRFGPRGLSAPAPRWGAAVMMAITVTMLIYLVILAPAAFQQAGSAYVPFTLTDDLVHIITPCLVIFDWFLFTPKGKLHWFDPPCWAGLPYAYLAFAFTWSALGGDFGSGRRYPYAFMDVQAYGVGGVAVQILILTVSLEAFGYLYVVADKTLARVARKRAAQQPA
jgi:hypothetical protein